jgi:hypothetical protein
MVVMLTLTGLTLFASLAVGQDASELKPFVGKWRAYVTEGGKSTPIEITVQRDGSYSTVLYTQPPRSVRGRLELVDGKFRFKDRTAARARVSLKRQIPRGNGFSRPSVTATARPRNTRK